MDTGRLTPITITPSGECLNIQNQLSFFPTEYFLVSSAHLNDCHLPACFLSFAGIESFEEKINSFASSDVDENPNSWLHQAFKNLVVTYVGDNEGGGGGGSGSGVNNTAGVTSGKKGEGGDEAEEGNKLGDNLENPVLEESAGKIIVNTLHIKPTNLHCAEAIID